MERHYRKMMQNKAAEVTNASVQLLQQQTLHYSGLWSCSKTSAINLNAQSLNPCMSFEIRIFRAGFVI